MGDANVKNLRQAHCMQFKKGIHIEDILQNLTDVRKRMDYSGVSIIRIRYKCYNVDYL